MIRAPERWERTGPRLRTVAIVLAVLIAGAALAYRVVDKTWLWQLPGVIHAGGRDYNDPGPPVGRNPTWTTIGHIRPQGWPIESPASRYAPTVAYLCTGAHTCVPYALEGGP